MRYQTRKHQQLPNTAGVTGCLPNPPHSKGTRGRDKKKRKTRSCQLCFREKCPGRNKRKLCKRCKQPDIDDLRKVVLGEKDPNKVIQLQNTKLARKINILVGRSVSFLFAFSKYCCNSLLLTFNPCRNDGRSLFITSYEMPLNSFLQHTRLMNKINEDLHWRLYRNSRPRLRALNVSKACISKIKSIFFDKDGSLRDTIKNDVDPQHLYINFSNESCPYERNDKRWQVQL
jgi:hypothetical protein